MKKLNPEYINAVLEIVNTCPYFTHLAMAITRMDKGIADVQMDLSRVHLQAFGYVHGGAVASLIDNAAFWSSFCEIEQGLGITTVDLNINYLAPVQTGRLTAKGRRIKLGRTIGLGEALVLDEQGKLVAHGTSKFIIIPGFGFKGNPDLPPKFI
jgi:uncharacterized protein (TIGR00369 family)